ncbi:hypothetical protein M5689_008434 [Euphorbia peplus]|nr:hypothetical protein M5689_008434 [Euphorbia peplus]
MTKQSRFSKYVRPRSAILSHCKFCAHPFPANNIDKLITHLSLEANSNFGICRHPDIEAVVDARMQLGLPVLTLAQIHEHFPTLATDNPVAYQTARLEAESFAQRSQARAAARDQARNRALNSQVPPNTRDPPNTQFQSLEELLFEDWNVSDFNAGLPSASETAHHLAILGLSDTAGTSHQSAFRFQGSTSDAPHTFQETTEIPRGRDPTEIPSGSNPTGRALIELQSDVVNSIGVARTEANRRIVNLQAEFDSSFEKLTEDVKKRLEDFGANY